MTSMARMMLSCRTVVHGDVLPLPLTGCASEAPMNVLSQQAAMKIGLKSEKRATAHDATGDVIYAAAL